MALSPQEAGLLSGIRVVEAASMIMVPSVGAALADYGAQVVKLEPIEGDLNRRGHHIPGMPVHDYEYCFLPDNRGKRSLSIDLKAPEARAILRRLVEGADVFLTNHRPKSLEGLGLTWPELQAINPRLVYAHGTGFGDTGDEIDKPGFDSVCYWSRSGIEASLFPLDGWLGSLGLRRGRPSDRHGAAVGGADGAVRARAQRPRHARVGLAARERRVVELGDDPGEAARRAVPRAPAARGRAQLHRPSTTAPATGACSRWRSWIRGATGRRSAAPSAGPSSPTIRATRRSKTA